MNFEPFEYNPSVDKKNAVPYCEVCWRQHHAVVRVRGSQ